MALPFTVTRSKLTLRCMLAPMERRAPTWREWALSLCATAGIAAGFRVNELASEPYSALRVYLSHADVFFVRRFQFGLNASVIVLTAIWLFSAKCARFSRMTLPLVAILIAGAAWAELALALKWSVDSQYLVSGLPFAPVANFGLLGAQVALCYLVTLIPDDRLGTWRGVLVKVGLAAALYLVQLLVWTTLAGRALP